MLKTALRPHQAAALGLWEQSYPKGFGLFLQQRVGKTLVALAIADKLKLPRILVVAPAIAIPVWNQQREEHLEQDWEGEFRVISFGTAARDRPALTRWIRGGLMIVDESHRIKKGSSLWSRSVRGISRKASHRLALTGTPMSREDSLEDAWAQFNYLSPGIFGTWGNFKKRYCIMGGFKGKKVVGYKNGEEFAKILHQHSTRSLLKEVQDRPFRVQHKRVDVVMSPAERDRLADLEERLATIVNGVKVSAPLVLTQSLKLQQITGGFILDENKVAHRVGYSKEKAFLNLVDSLPDPHLVIGVRYVHELERIRELGLRLGKTVQVVCGSEKSYDLQNPAEWIIIQLQSGVAIDLSVATTFIFYSWDYSYINYDQLRFRVVNFHSTKITYYYLVAGGTIDELILQSVRRKQRFADLVCEHWRRGSHSDA